MRAWPVAATLPTIPCSPTRKRWLFASNCPPASVGEARSTAYSFLSSRRKMAVWSNLKRSMINALARSSSSSRLGAEAISRATSAAERTRKVSSSNSRVRSATCCSSISCISLEVCSASCMRRLDSCKVVSRWPIM